MISLILLAPLISAPEPPLQCDDGSSLYSASGTPNWECTIEGCAPNQTCWTDSISHCYDSAGHENGACALEDQRCSGAWSCFSLWWKCDGAWHCLEDTPTSVGCKKGICISE